MDEAVANLGSDPAVAEMRAAGVDDEVIAGLVRRTAYNLAFHMTYLIDAPDGTWYPDEPHHHVDADHPRWRLMEVAPDGSLTGRDVGGLHESLMETDPRGEEADGWV
jgi:hypothetical protein